MNRNFKKLCLCGCKEILPVHWYDGRPQVFRFIQGHQNIGRMAWNKGKAFSLESRHKMSLARLGKEPANKAKIDPTKLRQLYVGEQKNARQVAKELDISYDAVKNRLRFLKLSRSTKESCSGSVFREQMRKIRIQTLISKPVIKSPNKLEKLVYNTLDKFGISYKKQVPLFNKFVVDVLFPKNNLVLEIFGRYWHEMPVNKKKDFSKKKYLLKCGYKVEEIWDYEIKQEGVEPILQKVFKKYNIV